MAAFTDEQSRYILEPRRCVVAVGIVCLVASQMTEALVREVRALRAERTLLAEAQTLPPRV